MIYDQTVHIATLEQLLAPYAKLDESQLRLTSIYIDLLLKWNARTNLTSVRDPEEIVGRHFGESFFAAQQLQPRENVCQAIDLGSGAGFPGLPMAMLMPKTAFTLIEAQQKKATFLREVIFALSLKNVKVYSGRAESFPGKGDLVTMRAVERFDKVLPLAVSLTAPGGRLALMIGGAQVAQVLGCTHEMDWGHPASVPGGHSRMLLIGTRKVKVG